MHRALRWFGLAGPERAPSRPGAGRVAIYLLAFAVALALVLATRGGLLHSVGLAVTAAAITIALNHVVLRLVARNRRR